MALKVKLTYFKQTGKLLAEAETTVTQDALSSIWQEVGDMRRLGRLPGLRPGSGRDLLILVDTPDHPQRELHLVMPPFIDEGDVTPPRIPTGELPPATRAREAPPGSCSDGRTTDEPRTSDVPRDDSPGVDV